MAAVPRVASFLAQEGRHRRSCKEPKTQSKASPGSTRPGAADQPRGGREGAAEAPACRPQPQIQITQSSLKGSRFLCRKHKGVLGPGS